MMVRPVRDVTDAKRAEATRRDFVANASHELRTPVAAIRMAAETLLDGALKEPGTARGFVEIVARHAERLTHLTRDLIDLSRLESGQWPFELRPVALAGLALQLEELYGAPARAKGLTLLAQVPAGPVLPSSHRTDARLPAPGDHPRSESVPDAAGRAASRRSSTMANEQNLATGHRFLEGVLNRGDLALVDEIFDPGFVDHSAPLGLGGDRESVKVGVSAMRRAFPDARFELADEIADGEKVVSRIVGRGTMRESLFGLPATGRTAA
jgi:hypothetical protein